ncbi:MAG: TrkH family potassium uptake protein [Proteobacteria bacterium]|nr:TrkH family potassium uptake protein [Pseudomonadota bacterium]
MLDLLQNFARKAARIPPPLMLAALYAALILVGAVALKLPVAHVRPLSWSEVLFTSTSAVTVTGLSVIDVGQHLTLFGQVVIAVLMQLGGIGLMTFAALVLGALGMSVGLTGQIYLRNDLNHNSMNQLLRLVRLIVKIVLICEVAGAVLLTFAFVPRSGLGQGLWEAVFHSISAFNNAGFSTFSEGLAPFATDPVINIVIPALFIVGGIGYVVLHDLHQRDVWHGWTLNTKVMLTGTAALIVWSVSMFAFLEWDNPGTLGALDSRIDRLIVSWFQGVTPRTAGFNTTNISAMHDSTSMMFISLMLIGGGPSSTAGGIKVTTFAVMLVATVAFFRRQSQFNLFGRAVAMEEVLKVMALTVLSLMIVFVSVFLLAASNEGHFLDITFEVASAFGTVGLSRGYTTSLNEFGRVVIMVVMFIGRVGPLTLGFVLATQTVPRVRYPVGKIHLG